MDDNDDANDDDAPGTAAGRGSTKKQRSKKSPAKGKSPVGRKNGPLNRKVVTKRDQPLRSQKAKTSLQLKMDIEAEAAASMKKGTEAEAAEEEDEGAKVEKTVGVGSANPIDCEDLPPDLRGPAPKPARTVKVEKGIACMHCMLILFIFTCAGAPPAPQNGPCHCGSKAILLATNLNGNAIEYVASTQTPTVCN